MRIMADANQSGREIEYVKLLTLKFGDGERNPRNNRCEDTIDYLLMELT